MGNKGGARSLFNSCCWGHVKTCVCLQLQLKLMMKLFHTSHRRTKSGQWVCVWVCVGGGCTNELLNFLLFVTVALPFSTPCYPPDVVQAGSSFPCRMLLPVWPVWLQVSDGPGRHVLAGLHRLPGTSQKLVVLMAEELLGNRQTAASGCRLVPLAHRRGNVQNYNETSSGRM